MTRMILGLALALAAASSCKKSEDKKKEASSAAPEAAAPVGAEDQKLAGEWTALYDQYAAAMEGAGGDCAKVATAVGEVNARNAELIAKGKPRMKALRADPAAARWLDDTHKHAQGAALDRMAPTLDRCRGDAAVSAALAAGAFERTGHQPH
jgi:hypothetical protein